VCAPRIFAGSPGAFASIAIQTSSPPETRQVNPRLDDEWTRRRGPGSSSPGVYPPAQNAVNSRMEVMSTVVNNNTTGNQLPRAGKTPCLKMPIPFPSSKSITLPNRACDVVAGRFLFQPVRGISAVQPWCWWASAQSTNAHVLAINTTTRIKATEFTPEATEQSEGTHTSGMAMPTIWHEQYLLTEEKSFFQMESCTFIHSTSPLNLGI